MAPHCTPISLFIQDVVVLMGNAINPLLSSINDALEAIILTMHNEDFSRYRQVSNIRHTKFPNLNVSPLILQLSLPNTLKSSVKSRMKI